MDPDSLFYIITRKDQDMEVARESQLYGQHLLWFCIYCLKWLICTGARDFHRRCEPIMWMFPATTMFYFFPKQLVQWRKKIVKYITCIFISFIHLFYICFTYIPTLSLFILNTVFIYVSFNKAVLYTLFKCILCTLFSCTYWMSCTYCMSVYLLLSQVNFHDVGWIKV